MTLQELAFHENDYKGLPSEKQAYAIVKWLSLLYTALVEGAVPTGSQQRFVVTELNRLLEYIGNSPEKDQTVSKAVRLQISKVYGAVYTGESVQDLYETVNKLLGLLNGKEDKYSCLKQYVDQAYVALSCQGD